MAIGRRGRAEVARLAGLYRSSGMERGEFCRTHGLSLSTLHRHLKKQQHQPHRTSEEAGKLGRLVEVEVSSAAAVVVRRERASMLTVLLATAGVEVDRGFDVATLGQLLTVLERF